MPPNVQYKAGRQVLEHRQRIAPIMCGDSYVTCQDDGSGWDADFATCS